MALISHFHYSQANTKSAWTPIAFDVIEDIKSAISAHKLNALHRSLCSAPNANRNQTRPLSHSNAVVRNVFMNIFYGFEWNAHHLNQDETLFFCMWLSLSLLLFYYSHMHIRSTHPLGRIENDVHVAFACEMDGASEKGKALSYLNKSMLKTNRH